MKILLNLFGVEVRNKQAFRIEGEDLTLRATVHAIDRQEPGLFERFLGADGEMVEGTVALVNGRNILSLKGWETRIKDGDEISFMVLVAGG